MVESGELKTFNSDKDRAKEIITEVIIRHRDAFIQARNGKIPGKELEEITDNMRVLNRVRGLNLIISAQREMINISRSQIRHSCYSKWKKTNSKDSEKEKNPFEEEDNDYYKLMYWRDFLKTCTHAIIQAEKTPSKDDDFMIERTDFQGNKINELTENYYDMLDDLEDSYEDINRLMLIYKIVSSGIEQNEEMEYIEKEQEMKRRVESA